jgi:predicted MFS family arabinose efflux permease
MIKKFLNNFKKLPTSNKSMVYLMWIYGAGGIIGSIFINIYVFSLNKELIDVFIYNLIFLTTTLIGFSLV